MALELPRIVVVFLLLLVFPLSLTEEINSIESVPDLQKLMYKVVDGYPCVRLLNLSGEIGCSNPGPDKVVAPIIKFKDAKDLTQPHTFWVTVDEMDDFFARVSNDSSFASNIGGVLVDSRASYQQKMQGFSPDKKFPQAEFSSYNNTVYEWNPTASGIMWKAYNFPVYLLSESGISAVLEITSDKEVKRKAKTADVAEFNMVMETTKSGTRNSESCLQEGTCLPLGGYSVWSSLPPINDSQSNEQKPIVLTVASMDSASFFRDQSFGADSPISGQISLLAAVDALSRVDGFNNLKKQLVFLVLTGEAWGYLGSRRFLHELDLHSDAVAGLNSTLIESVLEVGSIGKGLSGHGVKTFYAHKTRVSSITDMTLNALKQAQDSLASENIKILPADASNPGIPPSSLMAFMRKNPQTSAIVLEDFDTKFANKFYHSHLDDLSNINSSAVVAAASVVARTLYLLASDIKDTNNSVLRSINVNASLVEELMSCLLDCDPGLSCDLVKSYISPSNTCPSNYAGVIIGEPSSTPDPAYVSDISRFVWSFLADRTSSQKGNNPVLCSKGVCENKEQMCIKAETQKEGICVISTTRYVPAYSTRVKYKDESWTVLPPNSSDSMGMSDPVWTESNWNTIGVRVYTIQHSGYDNIVLIGGITVTVLSYLAILAAKAFITKALKRD